MSTHTYIWHCGFSSVATLCIWSKTLTSLDLTGSLVFRSRADGNYEPDKNWSISLQSFSILRP
uniref:Uncharacterized protein n=1 Tax=Anguilla anguilla TaxID=7936 RepID=A0A0E9PML2_ANGAN